MELQCCQEEETKLQQVLGLNTEEEEERQQHEQAQQQQRDALYQSFDFLCGDTLFRERWRAQVLSGSVVQGAEAPLREACGKGAGASSCNPFCHPPLPVLWMFRCIGYSHISFWLVGRFWPLFVKA